MDHQTLGQWGNRPSDPAYYIEDCRIFNQYYRRPILDWFFFYLIFGLSSISFPVVYYSSAKKSVSCNIRNKVLLIKSCGVLFLLKQTLIFELVLAGFGRLGSFEFMIFFYFLQLFWVLTYYFRLINWWCKYLVLIHKLSFFWNYISMQAQMCKLSIALEGTHTRADSLYLPGRRPPISCSLQQVSAAVNKICEDV